MTSFILNRRKVDVDLPGDTSILEVVRDHFGLKGTKYGCGATMCGACMIHVDGKTSYGCVTTLQSVAGKEVTTIEGLSADGSHPLQKAWVAEQVPQCGYCQSGQIMRAAVLLEENSSPSRAEIKEYMATNLCRCGTYNRIVDAIQRVARENENG
jgi:isoquinoline 1-oxidoreductase alpha subunit